MANHPRRSSKARDAERQAAERPAPAEIRRKREAAGLTQEQAASLVSRSQRAWENYESEGGDNDRPIPLDTWELFNIKLRALELLERSEISPAELRRLGITLPKS